MFWTVVPKTAAYKEVICSRWPCKHVLQKGRLPSFG